MDNVVQLERRWELGEQLGKGGFGRVFAAQADDGSAAAVKLVPKEPGAARELLFADLDGVRNVVPVLDAGETAADYVIVMPRATESLADRLDATGGPLPLEESLAVLTDVAAALADLDGRVVHRDLKPQNVLLVDGAWCLADFGISRYTEAATATYTHKESGTSEYAAPERWRSERATAAADVYALGVMAFELLSGELPFPGPDTADYRHQHLHTEPPRLAMASPRLAALVSRSACTRLPGLDRHQRTCSPACSGPPTPPCRPAPLRWPGPTTGRLSAAARRRSRSPARSPNGNGAVRWSRPQVARSR